MKLLPLALSALSGLLIAFGSDSEATAGAGGTTNFYVTKLTDTNDGDCSLSDCSLREAIIAANADTGLAPVKVNLMSGVHVLSREGADTPGFGDLDVTNDMTISGNFGSSVIDANGIDRILEVSCGACTAAVNLSSVALRDGSSVKGMAVLVSGGTLSSSAVDIVSNDGLGGALHIAAGAIGFIDNSIIRNNHRSPVASGHIGGGINNKGTLTLQRTTISGNTALDNGGGIANFGTLTAKASTISGNTAEVEGGGTSRGGGIYQANPGGPATIENLTVAKNKATLGAGVFSADDNFDIVNTIVGLNIGNDCGGTINTLGNNLDSDGTCDLDAGANDVIDVDPKLGPLKNNSGINPTHALLGGSPALENGDNADCFVFDQRNVARPQGGNCDIGAFEAGYCFGKPETKRGTGSAETINGTSGADVILGLAGNDVINGLQGVDRLCGGDQNDELHGGPGNDRLNGGTGGDACYGEGGDDVFANCDIQLP